MNREGTCVPWLESDGASAGGTAGFEFRIKIRRHQSAIGAFDQLPGLRIVVEDVCRMAGRRSRTKRYGFWLFACPLCRRISFRGGRFEPPAEVLGQELFGAGVEVESILRTFEAVALVGVFDEFHLLARFFEGSHDLPGFGSFDARVVGALGDE